ncbi:hypothetical protein ACA910_000434 [Epithemia clementina (nom. ined.)]
MLTFSFRHYNVDSTAAEKAVKDDKAEVPIFTDNQHAKSGFYRGTAKSPEVLNLMFRLHRILIKGYAFIPIVWIAGRKMIDQGTDGLSRADLTNGVMRGTCMLEFIPLAKTAMEQQKDKLNNFLRFVLGQDMGLLHLLTPEEWYTRYMDKDGMFLWCLPPCLEDVAIYLLAEAHHIRPWNTHLMLIPSIMAERWRKMLYKASDFVCTLPFAEDLWPMVSEYEPLTLAFTFPMLNRTPWRVRRSDVCVKRDDSDAIVAPAMSAICQEISAGILDKGEGIGIRAIGQHKRGAIGSQPIQIHFHEG